MTKYIVTAYDITKGEFKVNWDISNRAVALALYKKHLESGMIHICMGKQLEVKQKLIPFLEVVEE